MFFKICSENPVIVIPVLVVFIGRKLMDMWMPQTKVHELYTAACGLYVCWLALRATVIVSQWLPLGWSNLMAKLKDWVMLVS